jgi:hypothetical protein
METGETYGRICLINIALSNDTERMFRRARAVAERGLTTVASAGIDLIELYQSSSFPSRERDF